MTATCAGAGRGFVLPELLTAILMTSLMLTSLVAYAATHARMYRRIDEHLSANQNLRLVIDVLSRDVRDAGFDARGHAVEPAAVATSTMLVLQRDLDGDGSIDGASQELVTYAFRPETGVLSRIVGRQSMPLASQLPADGFRLSYAGDAGAALAPNGDALDAEERRRLRRIDVSLTFRDPAGRPLAGATTAVALRNMPWRD
jgi:Tfp pilus assembly protein PilW